MRFDPDLMSSVRSWLDPGADRLPERVLDRVSEAVSTTPQRRPLWPLRRFSTMSKIVRVAVVAAAILVAGCGAAQLQPTSTPGVAGRQAVTTPPSATTGALPSPTAAPSDQGTSSSFIPGLTSADVGATLAAGTYMPGIFGKGMLVTLPDGFALERLDEGNAAFSGPRGYLGLFIPEAVFPDPCHASDPPAPVKTGDDLVAALTTMKGFSAGPVKESTVSGRRARMFELSNTIDTSTAGCTRDAMLPLFTYRGHADGAATNGNTRQVVWVIDGQVKDGLLANAYSGPILVVADSFETDADLEILKTIAASIQL